MNRSFRAHDSPQLQMQPAIVKSRQQLRATMLDNGDFYVRDKKEKEDEQLALFLEMKKSEKEQNDLLNNNPDYFDSPLGSKSDAVPIFHIPPSTVTSARKTAADEFLNSDNDKSDYDWLLTPPGTPLFPYLEMDPHRTMMSHLSSPKARLPVINSRVDNHLPEAPLRSSMLSKQTSSPSLSSSGLRRPSSSGGPGSRPSTPTSRSTVPSSSKPVRSSTPTSRPTLSSRTTTSASKPAAGPVKGSVSTSKLASVSARGTVTAPKVSSVGVRGTTSTSKVSSAVKPTLTPSKTAASLATKPVVSAPRSSTPTRSAPRSSTPTTRASVPPPKPVSRSATPTRRPTSTTVAPAKPSPSITKPESAVRSSVPSRGISPNPAGRSWKPSDMPGYSHEVPPNLKTTVSDRTSLTARGRPGAPSARSSSIEPASNVRTRRQSCSPSRGRAPNGYLHASGGSVPALNRLNAKANDNISPVVMGTKMVERVINMRKLAPPRADDKLSPHSNLSGKASSPDSSGFGRTISKKSLDMAIRHMDIRRTLPGSLRPLMASIPASSMYSVRTGPSVRNRTSNITDSPVATSSNASSEVSYNNTGLYLDSIEFEDIGSERPGRSPLRGR